MDIYYAQLMANKMDRENVIYEEFKQKVNDCDSDSDFEHYLYDFVVGKYVSLVPREFFDGDNQNRYSIYCNLLNLTLDILKPELERVESMRGSLLANL